MMIIPSKPACIGNIPVPCLITKGYSVFSFSVCTAKIYIYIYLSLYRYRGPFPGGFPDKTHGFRQVPKPPGKPTDSPRRGAVGGHKDDIPGEVVDL
jgi:hypothetical protein